MPCDNRKMGKKNWKRHARGDLSTTSDQERKDVTTNKGKRPREISEQNDEVCKKLKHKAISSSPHDTESGEAAMQLRRTL